MSSLLKFVVFVTFLSGAMLTCEAQYITDRLSTADPEDLVAYTSVLIEIIRSVPEAFEQKSDVIVAILLKQVLLKPSFDPVSVLYITALP